jgi:hypothetical protein
MGARLASLIALAATAPVTAQTVYDDLDSGTDGIAWAGDLVLDDLHVEGGGLLRTVTVAVTAPGAAAVTDLALSLAVDGGDGFPDLDGTGDDAFLFQTFRPGVSVPAGGTVEVAFDVSELWTIVPDDALLFGGLQIDNPAVGHTFYGAPTIGSTDGIVWSFAMMGPVPVPSAGDPKLESSDALAFRLEVVPLPGPAEGRGVVGDAIDFEDLDEGPQGTSVMTGDVTFTQGRDGFPPPIDATFVVDDGTGVWEANPDMLDFVQGKVLQLNAFSPGPDGYAFAVFKSMEMTSGPVHTGVRMNVAYVSRFVEGIDFSSALITLLALRDGVMVATDVINPDRELGESGGGSFTFGAGTLEISGVEFDSLVLFTNGPGPFGAVQMGVDNVVLGDAACPGDVDLDDVIDTTDLLLVLAAWGPCPESPECPADLDGDGMVATSDLLIVLADWGPCKR